MRPGGFQKVLVEALIVAGVGAGIAFAANFLSPRGLALNRDYFPTNVASTNRARSTPPAASQAVSNSSAPSSGQPSEASTIAAGDDEVAARLKSKGLTCIGRAEVERLAGDPQVVFVDARDDEKFAAGHIRGALELDPYHPEKQLGAVLAASQSAKQVVVYCAGGECEDADTVAIMLRDAGIPAGRVVVYGGGMNDWSAHHEPVETGARP